MARTTAAKASPDYAMPAAMCALALEAILQIESLAEALHAARDTEGLPYLVRSTAVRISTLTTALVDALDMDRVTGFEQAIIDIGSAVHGNFEEVGHG